MVGSEETCDLRETHGGERGGMRRNAERCREDQPSRAAVLAPWADIFDGERLRCNVGVLDLATMAAPSGRCRT